MTGNRSGCPNKKTLVLRQLTREAGLNIIEKLEKALDEIPEPRDRAYLLIKLLEFYFPKRAPQEGIVGESEGERRERDVSWDRFRSMSPETLKELVKKDLAADEKKENE